MTTTGPTSASLPMLATPSGSRSAVHQPDAGVYFESGYLFNELSFVTGTGDPLKIDQQYEVGGSFGFRDRATIWVVTLPRVGVGYRFGGGLKGIRIRIGGNRVLRLPNSED